MSWHPRPPVRSARDCWDWITPDDVLRHALAAYYLACRRAQAHRGAFISEGLPWSDRLTWLETLAYEFEQRLGEQAHRAGVPDCAGYAERLQRDRGLQAGGGL